MPDLLALPSRMTFFFFFLNDPAPTKISPLPLPAALPICVVPVDEDPRRVGADGIGDPIEQDRDLGLPDADDVDAAEHGPQAVLLQRDRRGLEPVPARSEEHTSELQSPCNLVCRLLLEKKK